MMRTPRGENGMRLSQFRRSATIGERTAVTPPVTANAGTVSSYAHQYASVGGRYCQQHPSTVALHSTEALMAGFLKSSDLGPHPHGYGSAHHPHHAHPHGPLPPGMPMTSLAPFGLPHGLDAVGFPQGRHSRSGARKAVIISAAG
uniref:Uncharacterized protein n=1 Tax=Anopheles melas TaxID=34690 RepID=A0A182TMU8_9DIPT